MAATIEIKYYNSFWLKKMAEITKVSSLDIDEENPNTVASVGDAVIGTNTITVPNSTSTFSASSINIGQSVDYTISSILYSYTIVYKQLSGANTVITLSKNIVDNAVPNGTILSFGKIDNNAWIPSRYANSINQDWYIEEARIRGGYNNVSVDFGVKAYIVEDNNQREYLYNSLIYSGVFNSKTGINNTNQFSVGDDITRTVDPANGSIQKLYSENTDLTIFQELKVSRALIDKDAIYSADGQPMTTSGTMVIGQVQAYTGNYGIGKHPESFAVYGYRKYFVDDYQNVVLRLSQDGITEISAYGMLDYFRDRLSSDNLNNGYLLGAWDIHSKQYILSIQPTKTVTVGSVQYSVVDDANSSTLSFDEDSNGWVSFLSYIPNYSVSLRNHYYTTKSGAIWKHYSTTVPRASFYNTPYKSEVTVVFNPSVSEPKSFLTINYEGTSNWNLSSINSTTLAPNSFYTDTDNSAPVSAYTEATTLLGLQNQLFENKFKKKENKYFVNLLNISAASNGEISYGASISGLKGFFGIATITCDNATKVPTINTNAELFAVSAEYIASSY